MKLTLRRRFFGDNYTVGTLLVDGQPFCDTLENTDRGLDSGMSPEEVLTKKIYGQTAIPTGTYPVTVTPSPRFKRPLPRLYGVPGFEGVLIHAGNTPADTAGCILVGENRARGRVLDSRAWENRLLERLENQKNITIEIIRI